MRRNRIPLDELAGLPSVYFVTPDWDRTRYAFYWDRSGRMELYTAGLPGGEPEQVSHGEVPRSLRAGFAWSRDGRRIVFAKDRDGNEQHDLHALDLDTGRVEILTDTPHAQEIPVEFSPDDRYLSMRSNRDGQMNLYRLRPDGSEVTPLTRLENPVRDGGIWSPDGTRLAFCANETDELKNADVYVVNADGSGLRRVLQVAVGSIESVAQWLPDGRRLAITSDASGVDRPGVVDVDTGEARFLGTDGIEEWASGVSDDGRLLLAFRNRDAMIRPVVYDIESGEVRVLDLPAGVCSGGHFVLDDTALLLVHASPTTRNEVLLYDLASDDVTVLLKAAYGSIDPQAFVAPTSVHYPSTDGLDINALLYAPERIEDGQGLPAVVSVHGGPTGQFSRGFDPYAQFLVDQGFVVLEPNVRGSTGYGVAFRDMNRYDWGGGDLEDVAAGAAYLKTLPYVDPDRIGVFGGSYGGYMTLMQVVKKPDLWKAGVAWIGISDLKRLYAKSMEHFKYYLRWQMGEPGENEALWRDRSALTHAGNLRAKLLLVHGENDPRCPVEQSRLFRDRLVELGYEEGEDFEYVELAGEGHGSSDIAQKVRTYRLLSDFMTRRL